MNELERLPPQNIEAEQSVLGAMLLAPDAVGRVIELLHAESFYRTAHQKIYETIKELFEKGEPSDLITVSDLLRGKEQLEEIGGMGYLAELAGSIPTAANVEYYARIIEEKALRRELIKSGTEIVGLGYDESIEVAKSLDQAEQLILDIAQKRRSNDLVHIKDILHESYETISQRYEQQDSLTGVPSGFYDLDHLTAGLQPSDLIILAARPAMGKTAFCLNLAQNVATAKMPVAVFSLEMSKEQLVQRLLCAEAGIDAHRLKTGYLAESDWPRLTEAIGKLAEAPLYIDDTASISALEIRSKCRRLKTENKGQLGLVVIDYLQLMEGSGNENRVQEISQISRSLKGLARELHAPVIALSQLSRAVESRTDKRPMLSDLRESGSIEQDADIVIFIYRDEYYNPESAAKNIAEIIIAKHRNGPTGKVELFFKKECTRFESLNQRYVEA
ncbi:MAG: replicative DNA helicase [Bacteroidota bacterium]